MLFMIVAGCSAFAQDVSLLADDTIDDVKVTLPQDGGDFVVTVIQDAYNRNQWYYIPKHPRVVEVMKDENSNRSTTFSGIRFPTLPILPNSSRVECCNFRQPWPCLIRRSTPSAPRFRNAEESLPRSSPCRRFALDLPTPRRLAFEAQSRHPEREGCWNLFRNWRPRMVQHIFMLSKSLLD